MGNEILVGAVVAIIGAIAAAVVKVIVDKLKSRKKMVTFDKEDGLISIIGQQNINVYPDNPDNDNSQRGGIEELPHGLKTHKEKPKTSMVLPPKTNNKQEERQENPTKNNYKSDIDFVADLKRNSPVGDEITITKIKDEDK